MENSGALGELGMGEKQKEQTESRSPHSHQRLRPESVSVDSRQVRFIFVICYLLFKMLLSCFAFIIL